MDIRLHKLISEFELKGWSLRGPVDIASDWWRNDIFELISKWHPVGTSIYMTLLTDPQILHKKITWCIGVSSNIPGSRHFEFITTIALNDIRRLNLEEFVENVNKIVLSESKD